MYPNNLIKNNMMVWTQLKVCGLIKQLNKIKKPNTCQVFFLLCSPAFYYKLGPDFVCIFLMDRGEMRYMDNMLSKLRICLKIRTLHINKGAQRADNGHVLSLSLFKFLPV